LHELIKNAIEKAKSLVELLEYMTTALSKNVDDAEVSDAIETVYGEVNDLSITIDELREAITHSQPIVNTVSDVEYYDYNKDKDSGGELNLDLAQKPEPESKTTILRFCSACRTEYRVTGDSYVSNTGVFTIETDESHCCAFCGNTVANKMNLLKTVSLKALNSLADIVKPKVKEIEVEVIEIDYYPDPIVVNDLLTYFPVKEEP